MMRKIYTVIIFCLCSSCNREITGLYRSGIISLELNGNGKFEFLHGEHLSFNESNGIYSYDKDKKEIILQSEYKTYNIPFVLEQAIRNHLDRSRIKLRNSTQIQYSIISKIELIINDTIKVQINSLDTTIEMKTPLISTLSISMYPNDKVAALNKRVSTRTISLSPPQNELFLTTCFQNKHFFYVNIYDTLKIEGRRIFWPALNTSLVR